MIATIFRTMLFHSLRDKISLFYATAFPIVLLVGLGLYFDSPDYLPLLTTGIVGLGSVFWALQGIAFQVMQQRNKGVYKLLQMTPFPTLSFILTLTAARTLLGLMMNMLVLATGVIVFGFSISWSALIVMLLVLTVGSLCFTCIGFLIANLAKNEAQINAYSNLLYLPMVFASEAFYRLEGAPAWIETLGRWFPFAHFIDGMRGAIAGDGGTVGNALLILLGFGILALLLATFTFRWDESQAIVNTRSRKA